MEDYGWSVQDRIANAFPDIRFDNSNQVPFLKRMFKSRLVVTDHPSSTYLLGLSANVPSVLFWDPNLFEMKPEAEVYFEKLRQVGILWHSPEEAAEKVASIYCDPWVWWGTKEVQDARMSFISRIALPAKDWLKLWVEGLKKELAVSQLPNLDL